MFQLRLKISIDLQQLQVHLFNSPDRRLPFQPEKYVYPFQFLLTVPAVGVARNSSFTTISIFRRRVAMVFPLDSNFHWRQLTNRSSCNSNFCPSSHSIESVCANSIACHERFVFEVSFSSSQAPNQIVVPALAECTKIPSITHPFIVIIPRCVCWRIGQKWRTPCGWIFPCPMSQDYFFHRRSIVRPNPFFQQALTW